MNAAPAHPTPQSRRLWALVPCAGTGQRAGTPQPKQYQPLAGARVIDHTLLALLRVGRLHQVLVVTAPDDPFTWPHARLRVAPVGGATRADSVRAGLEVLVGGCGADPQDWVLVHDAARCLIEPAWVDALIDAVLPDAVGGLLAIALADTLKQENQGRVAHTVPRVGKWLAQTPQMFRIGPLLQALDAARAAGVVVVTDEASALEAQGLCPRLVPGHPRNFKLTYPDDFLLAEALLALRQPLPQEPSP